MTFPFPLFSPTIASASGALDGTSPTGAWSMSRDLLTSFAGGTRYTTVTGVDSLKDQTGGGGHFNQSGTGLQPAVTTAGPNSRTCADFDGSDDYLQNANQESSFVTTSAGFIIVSGLIDTIGTDSSTPTSDQAILGDTSGGIGIALRSTGPKAMAYGFDSNFDTAEATMPAVTNPVVLTWRHDGGNLYVSANGGTEVSVAHGNTFSLAFNFRLAFGFGGVMNGKIFEAAMWNSGSTPDATTRAAIISNFMTWTGAT